MSEEKGLSCPFSGFPRCCVGLPEKGRKGQKRAKKGEKGDFGRFPGRAVRHPFNPPFVTPPFAAAQRNQDLQRTCIGQGLPDRNNDQIGKNCPNNDTKFRRKTEGQQLKGKIVSALFSHFFTLLHTFHTFSEFLPQDFSQN